MKNMKLKVLKVRRVRPKDLQIHWDLSKMKFDEQEIFEKHFGYRRGNIVRVKATGWLAEVIEIQDPSTVKLRRLNDGWIHYHNPTTCVLTSGLEALAEQAE